MSALTFIVPGREYRMDVDAAILWNKTGLLINVARGQRLEDELIFSVILSRVMRELRRKHGPAVARDVLRGFIDTMDAAAANDLPGEGR